MLNQNKLLHAWPRSLVVIIFQLSTLVVVDGVRENCTFPRLEEDFALNFRHKLGITKIGFILANLKTLHWTLCAF